MVLRVMEGGTKQWTYMQNADTQQGSSQHHCQTENTVRRYYHASFEVCSMYIVDVHIPRNPPFTLSAFVCILPNPPSVHADVLYG